MAPGIFLFSWWLMAQAFSNPEPADDASFENDAKPVLYRVQITDASVVDTALSRLNVNGSWYSVSPTVISLWTTPDRAGVLAFGAGGGTRYPVLEDDTEYEWYLEITETGGGGTFTSSTYTFTIGLPSRQISLSSPTNEDTGITLQPLLEWTIGGDGAQDGDLLDIYIKKDDSDFGADDLIGDLVDAALNSDKQIIAGLEYDATYYWQVQAANSAEGYGTLLSSAIYSFTVQSFSPPAYSTRTVGEDTFPTGANNMLTIQRLIAAANGKIWYEVIEDI